MTTEEQVLVVPRSAVIDGDGWLGVVAADAGAFEEVVDRQGRFEPRSAVESDPAFKQVIPYLVLRDEDRYFLMRRTRAGGDVRLHDRRSIGVGGHLNPGDDGLLGGLRREWREELEADFEPAFEPLGLLNDDTTDVGAVHLGVVFVSDAAGRPVAVRERDKLSGAFAPAAEVSAVAPDLETWSRLVFEFLEAQPAPALAPGPRGVPMR